MKEPLAIRCVPGRQPREHLVEHHAHVPPVRSQSMAPLIQNLGRKVLGSAAKRVRTGIRVTNSFLRQPKVRELHVAVLVQQDVLWLEISVDDLDGVQVLQGACDLRRVEPCSGLRQALLPREPEEELASGAVVQHEVKLLRRLEGEVHAHDKGVPHHAQDTALCPSVLDLPPPLHMVFAQDLHCVDQVRVSLLNEEHFAEGSFANDLE
mmetsp:Transcript_29000/g.84662  ORF Transcript_29000/g.84662 Transcript_29000/m.84662 type:complete len:208 (+) Transcript_29000:561-1184(+)